MGAAEFRDYLMGLSADDFATLKATAPAFDKQPRRKTFGFGEQKPVDTQQYKGD